MPSFILNLIKSGDAALVRTSQVYSSLHFSFLRIIFEIKIVLLFKFKLLLKQLFLCCIYPAPLDWAIMQEYVYIYRSRTEWLMIDLVVPKLMDGEDEGIMVDLELEELFTVHVKIERSIELKNTDGESVVMIMFGGHVTGTCFEGIVREGGVDTQVIGKDGGRHSLSARYMLQGQDYTGQPCEIYIENNGYIGETKGNRLFRTSPRIITNSKALSYLNTEALIGEGCPAAEGVSIRIFKVRS